MRQVIQEIRAGIYGGNMSNNYAASVMRDNLTNETGLFCSPRDEQADDMTRQMLREEVERHRAKVGIPAFPEHKPAADSGQRNRRSDVSEADRIAGYDENGGPAPRGMVSQPVNVGKHSHYFKPVAHLQEIDVYRICDLYCDDRSGATQHAIKKLLLPGERGAGKSREKDYQEAIDTLQRKLAMLREDAA